MNSLEKLKTMSDNEIQNWLRIIDPEDLKRGISGISEEIRKCIYRNMSGNAGKVLRDLASNNKKLKNNVSDIAVGNLEIALKQV
jgi:flagellar motor switch protein FliG